MDHKNYAVSAPDSPTYYPNWKNAAPDVLDIFLHHFGLPAEHVVSIDELNSDPNDAMLTIDCSKLLC